MTAEYKTSGHAIFDIQYHRYWVLDTVIWYYVGRLAEGAATCSVRSPWPVM